jgi:hypothetical protein
MSKTASCAALSVEGTTKLQGLRETLAFERHCAHRPKMPEMPESSLRKKRLQQPEENNPKNIS